MSSIQALTEPVVHIDTHFFDSGMALACGLSPQWAFRPDGVRVAYLSRLSGVKFRLSGSAEVVSPSTQVCPQCLAALGAGSLAELLAELRLTTEGR
jgi:hypothetical protein